MAERGEIGSCKATDTANVLCNGPLHVSGGDVVCGWCGKPQEGHPFTLDRPETNRPVPEPGIRLEAHAMGDRDRLAMVEKRLAQVEARLALLPSKKGA